MQDFLKRGGGGNLGLQAKKGGGPEGGPILGPILKSLHPPLSSGLHGGFVCLSGSLGPVGI